MKSVISLACAILAGCCAAAARAETLSSALLRKGCADPWLFRHEGRFYLAQTGSTKVLVYSSETLSGLSAARGTTSVAYDSAADPTVKELGFAGVNGTWSPEIHRYSDAEFPGHAGWYMFLALRDSAAGDSRHVKSVVLKALSDDPAGPYGHPATGEKFASQPVLGTDGRPYAAWAVGHSSLVIREGPWKGVYALYVTEKGRGTRDFYQEIRIARLKTPWQLATASGIVTVPTQFWETVGASRTGYRDPERRKAAPYFPRVVEGATAVYGDKGDVYLIYSGSGFWTNYGLGQLTWTGEDPLKTSSWTKFEFNPIFTIADKRGKHLPGLDLQGPGHASFFRDDAGARFLVYHAYPYNASKAEKVVDGERLAPGAKGRRRNAYVEPYRIDYGEWNGAGWGVFHIGLKGNAHPAASSSKISYSARTEDKGQKTGD
ncbi:MAG: hypothetical protein IJ658_06105 [Kiritimatiellae bacterium]|nr:hypothetical protein [Kiritimatiellia bacterium]